MLTMTRAIRIGSWSVRRLGVFALALVVWQILSLYLVANDVPPYVLPAPADVFAELPPALLDGSLPTYIGGSLMHLILAGGTGLVLGVIVGILIGLNRWVAAMLYPILNFFQALGGIAIAPLIIVWFGFSLVGLVVAVNYTIFFPIAFNTLTGVKAVPRVYISAARTMGAGQLRIIRDVILPGALPNILLGARLALAYGWRALIAIEMLFLIDGLGFMIFDAQQFLDTTLMLLGMLVLGTLVLLIDELILKPIEAMTIRRWGLVHR